MRDKIFGRKDYLDIITKRTNDLLEGYRQNIAFIGDELVGKTSIIYKFLNSFCNNRVIVIYLDVRHEALVSFVKRFIGVLLYNFLINSGTPLKEDVDFLIKKSAKFIPKTTEKALCILKAVSRGKRNEIFGELLSLCELIHEESEKSCVVIFDEFHNLENIGFSNLYRDWSKILVAQKNTMYLITSSMKFKAKNILSKNLSLLFGNFEVVSVEPFDIKTSEEYLTNRLEGAKIDSASKNFIVHFTGGYPFYLEVISNAIIKAERPDLAEVLEGLLFDSSGILNQKFSNHIKRFLDSNRSKDYISILYLISSGRNKIKDISHILRMTKSDLGARINQLLELDTITRSADFLKINDRVLSFWMKFVYKEKMDSLTFDAKNQKERFREEIRAAIKDFSSASEKPIAERMSELMHLFEDEIMQFERKKVKLAHFREVKPLEFGGARLKDGLLGRSSESLWIMAIKPEILTEEDIADFSKECKKYRNKPQQKIIVTLKDIDANTRLKALEEKIWAWDINSLNQILDLYSKPWVIA